MSLDFSLRLKNELSGPAQAAASSLEQVQSELKQTAAALDAVERKQKTVARALATGTAAGVGRSSTGAQKVYGGPMYRRKDGPTARAYAYKGKALVDTVRSGEMLAKSSPTAALGGVNAAAGGASSSIASSFSGGAAIAAIGAVAAAVGMLIMKFGQLALAAGTWLVQMQLQRQAALLSFKLMFGGVDQASAVYKQAIALSVKLGQSAEETVSVFQALGAQGMKAPEIETMVKSLADLKLVAPQIQSDRAISAIGQILSKGKLGLEELQGQLGDSANLNVGYVKDALGEILKVRGKTEAEIRSAVDKLISAGKVDSATGIKAVQMAISRMAGGGEAGAAAMAASKTLGGTLTQLANLPKNLALSFDLPGTEPIIAFGQAILKVLDLSKEDGAAAALQNSVGGLFKTVTGIFGQELPGASGIERIVYGVADAIDFIDTVVSNFAPISQALWGGMKEGFSEVSEALGPLASELGKLFGTSFASKGQMLAVVAREIGKGLAYIVITAGAVIAAITAITTVVLGLTAAIGGSFIGMVGMVGSAFSAVVETISSFFTRAYDAGGNIVQGVADGITARLGSVMEAANAIGNTAIAGVTSTLTIRSPSRVMAELGAHTAAGFVGGVDAGAPAVDASMANLVTPPAAGTPGASSSGGGRTININITVNGGSSPKETADAVAQALQSLFDGYTDSDLARA